MDRYTTKGAKKLFSLTKTKIRLAEEHDTIETIPKPLPLIKQLTGLEINTVEECSKHRDNLKNRIDYTRPENVAATVLQLMDIIEGVKYRYEPKEFTSNINLRRFRLLEEKATQEKTGINILLMTQKAPEGLNIYVGSNPPEKTIFLSAVPTTICVLANYLFNSDYFSHKKKLRNVTSVIGQKTVINNAIHYSLGVYGAKKKDEGSILSDT